MRIKTKIDWLGNITFAVGLIALLVGIVYGIQPYGGHTMGWTSPVRAVDGLRRARRPGRVRPDRAAGATTRCSGCSCSASGRTRRR